MISEEMKTVLPLYNDGLKLYKERKFSEAKKKFEDALKIIPQDGPTIMYIKRCEDYILSPPPEDWDGVYVMKTK